MDEAVPVCDNVSLSVCSREPPLPLLLGVGLPVWASRGGRAVRVEMQPPWAQGISEERTTFPLLSEWP